MRPHIPHELLRLKVGTDRDVPAARHCCLLKKHLLFLYTMRNKCGDLILLVVPYLLTQSNIIIFFSDFVYRANGWFTTERLQSVKHGPLNQKLTRKKQKQKNKQDRRITEGKKWVELLPKQDVEVMKTIKQCSPTGGNVFVNDGWTQKLRAAE